MALANGHTLLSTELQLPLRIGKKLAEGGQGEIYQVSAAGRSYALKWYHPAQATAEQKGAIAALVKHGPPKGKAGSRFLWPIDLVEESKSGAFGYVMPLLDSSRFATLGQVQAHRKAAPGYGSMCRISFQAASSYKQLHMAGYCYRDISRNNLLFDPHSGDIVICDNDNVGISNQSACQVLGTMENMPPELILNRAVPSTQSDLHALSVLLFELWIWHHPLHGLKEYQVRSWDLPAKIRIYGEEPLFVFDPENDSNRLPEDPEYQTARRRWQQCPPSVQELFLKAFTVGLQQPQQRVTEGQWQRTFLRLQDSMLSCPACRAENFSPPAGNTPADCWHCRSRLVLPPRLLVKHARGSHAFTLLLGKSLSTLFCHPEEEEKARLFGEVNQHPNNAQIWGIRNLTEQSWSIRLPDGSRKEVPPQRSAPLTIGLELDFIGLNGQIVS
ncbi:MAG: protein kinase [Magnetococcales bacterium]|nr:protein kinase [Magnetococcales bacterium]